MGTTPYPLPREIRQSDILDCDGVSTAYGPFTFKIFDLDDIDVYTRVSTTAQWVVTPATVTKVVGLPFDDFSITFSSVLPATTDFVVVGARTHEREYSITRGNTLDSVELEKELSKQGVVVQELRRDIDRGAKAPFGAVGPILPVAEAGRALIYDVAGNFVLGPNAVDIANAQPYAAQVSADKDLVQGYVDDIELALLEAPLNAPLWSNSVNYLTGKVVSSEGAIYKALVDNINKQPSISTEWVLLVGFAGGVLDRRLQFSPSTTVRAGVNLGAIGLKPVAPINGDLWLDLAGNIVLHRNGVDRVLLSDLSGSPSNFLVNRRTMASKILATVTGAASVIPQDNTAPQASEGFQLLSRIITPQSATNLIAARAVLSLTCNVAATLCAGLFMDGVCVQANLFRVAVANDPITAVLEMPPVAAGSLAVKTFTVSIGQDNAANFLSANGSSAVNLGATIGSMLTVEEFKA